MPTIDVGKFVCKISLVLTAVEPYLSLMSNDLFERTLSFKSANIVLATLARMYPKTSSV